MVGILQLVTIVAMLGFTYLFFSAFGPPRRELLYTREERLRWDDLIRQPMGSFFTIANIVGVLTSLATVYVFFIGNSKLFGVWIFVCVFTIWLGGYVTNYFTKLILRDSTIRERFEAPNQVAAAVASLFSRPTVPESVHTSMLVKYITLVNIGCIIWLDFAVFGDLSGLMLGLIDPKWQSVLLFISSFIVCHFTLKYGLRGFVFADSFHAPAILLGSLGVLLGAIILLVRIEPVVPIRLFDLLLPRLTLLECVVFVLATIFLNSFLVLVTEPHWMRVWMFRDKESTLQTRGTASTAITWTVLILIGLLTGSISSNVGAEAVADVLMKIVSISPLFVGAFWVAAMGALFASADAPIYGFLLVRAYQPRTGALRTEPIRTLNPARRAVVVALIFAAAYYVVRVFELPFEKLVFLLLPISMNIVPAFILLARGLVPRPAYTWVSLVLYAGCSVVGLAQPADQFLWTVMAPLAPAIVAAVAGMIPIPKEELAR